LKNNYEIRGDITAIFLKRRNKEVVETLISTSDLPKVMEYPNTWCFNYRGYVTGTRTVNKIKKHAVLHRWIFDDPKGMVIDHINHDTLNNTRENLRVVTQSENLQNRKGAMKNSKSGIRGVCWNKIRKKWQVQITTNKKLIHVGYFEDIKLAENAVVDARKKYMPYS
jgi:hypothetical protein